MFSASPVVACGSQFFCLVSCVSSIQKNICFFDQNPLGEGFIWHPYYLGCSLHPVSPRSPSAPPINTHAHAQINRLYLYSTTGQEKEGHSGVRSGLAPRAKPVAQQPAPRTLHGNRTCGASQSLMRPSAGERPPSLPSGGMPPGGHSWSRLPATSSDAAPFCSPAFTAHKCEGQSPAASGQRAARVKNRKLTQGPGNTQDRDPVASRQAGISATPRVANSLQRAQPAARCAPGKVGAGCRARGDRGTGGGGGGA